MQRLLETAFGLGIALAARYLIPGHCGLSLLAASALCLGGSLVAQFGLIPLLHLEASREPRYLVCALGALSVLLVSGVTAF